MTARIIDCNIWLVSAGKGSHMSSACQALCLQWLQDFWKSEDSLVMDVFNSIGKEYRANFRRYGVNPQDVAYQVLNSLQSAQTRRIADVRFEIDENGHAILPDDYPPAVFENADKKWVAAHLAHPERPVIYNAADTDWLKSEQFLINKNIPVENLCYLELQTILAKKEAG